MRKLAAASLLLRGYCVTLYERKDQMRVKEQERRDKGWKSDPKSVEEARTPDERSLDIGESDQFAPGGRTLDDIVPPGRR